MGIWVAEAKGTTGDYLSPFFVVTTDWENYKESVTSTRSRVQIPVPPKKKNQGLFSSRFWRLGGVRVNPPLGNAFYWWELFRALKQHRASHTRHRVN
jgi:hypothetical protein